MTEKENWKKLYREAVEDSLILKQNFNVSMTHKKMICSYIGEYLLSNSRLTHIYWENLGFFEVEFSNSFERENSIEET